MKSSENSNLKDIARLFLKLGLTAFGGPAAHIAMMRDEVVVKKKWLDEDRFLDLLGATNLIPGPNSTEMAIHLGHERAGWKGLVTAGALFIFPAVMITLFFAVMYKEFGALPEVQPFIYGIKPAIISVIVAAVYPLAKRSVKSAWLAFTALTVLALSIAGLSEIILMFGAGLVTLAVFFFKNRSADRVYSFSPGLIIPCTSFSFLGGTNAGLFFSFLKIGSILYGSGYVLFAFLETELVVPGLLTRDQLVDAIAVGQFTPGPVFSSVTFIGYQISGFTGAALATIGIFLPSFIFVALLNPVVKKMRNSKAAASFLDAVNVASVSLIASVLITMGRESLNDWRSILIAVLSLVIVFSFKKINSALVVAGGSILGWILTLVQI